MKAPDAFPTVEFFDNNQALHSLYWDIATLSHIWDDLVDKDYEVSEEHINRAFEIALCDLPANPLYAAIQQHVIPLWATIITNYGAANRMERSKDARSLEISHILRFEGMNIVVFAMIAALGRQRAEELAVGMWKAWVDQPVGAYVEEHSKA